MLRKPVAKNCLTLSLSIGLSGLAWGGAPITISQGSIYPYSGDYTSTDATTPAVTITATSGTVILQNCKASNSNTSNAAPTILIQPPSKSTAKIYIKNCSINNASLAAGSTGASVLNIAQLAGEVHIQGRASGIGFIDNINPCVVASANPYTPAIQVDTPSLVTIKKCTLTAKGEFIVSNTNRLAQLNVSDNKVRGINPGVASQAQGRFMKLLAPQSLTVTNNRIENTAGILVNGHGETGHVISDNIIITNNDVLNINGRYSDGEQGYQNTTQEIVQFVQFDKVLANPNKSIKISWNQVINEIAKSSVEDVINISSSSGSSAYPIVVSNNYLKGAYPTVLTAAFSGCGITTDRSPGGLVTHHISIDANQVIDTVNCGIGIAAGHHISATANRMIAENRSPSGTLITAANVGMYMMNLYGLDANLFATNSSTNNLSGWMGWQQSTPPNIIRNDYYFESGCANPACDASNLPYVSSSTSAYAPLPEGTSAAELQRWQQKLTANQVKIGPSW